jgi:hypothetical protein
VEITEVRRQRTDWQQQATRELATGFTAKALARYEDAGMVQGHAGWRRPARRSMRSVRASGRTLKVALTRTPGLAQRAGANAGLAALIEAGQAESGQELGVIAGSRLAPLVRSPEIDRTLRYELGLGLGQGYGMRM